MKYLICMMAIFFTLPTDLIFDFNKESDIDDWFIVDDGVMGGRSAGTFSLNADGFGLFEGRISLLNNGGFSSLRYRFDKKQIGDHTTIVLKLKGDGKNYQFRVKSNANEYYSYITTFETSGECEEIVIPLKDMYPSFRGRRLDLPNFSDKAIEELTFLIGNKKKESFKLLIDKIELR